jgi:hypothetical protein
MVVLETARPASAPQFAALAAFAAQSKVKDAIVASTDILTRRMGFLLANHPQDLELRCGSWIQITPVRGRVSFEILLALARSCWDLHAARIHRCGGSQGSTRDAANFRCVKPEKSDGDDDDG